MQSKLTKTLLGSCCVVLAAIHWANADEPAEFSAATLDGSGFLVQEVKSAYQAGATRIRVLTPAALAPGKRYPVIYMLPVEPAGEKRYGDGLLEVQKHDLHNKYQALFVAPDFLQLPWYADHPSDAAIRQESYLIHCVIPAVERNYPVLSGPAGRLLLGFSKSGWGAWALLLRHPEMFQNAAAWDAPLMMDEVGKYGSASIFGTQKNFESYQVTRLLREKGRTLGACKRLILLGYGGFRPQHQQAHALLDELSIAHEYRDGPERTHDWHSGWVPEAVDLLMVK